MILQKMHCPYGCQNSVLSESTKTISNPNQNLLLDDNRQFGSNTKTVKVYTCNCCSHTFEVPTSVESNLGGRAVL